MYPLNLYTQWDRNNYGPIWIPAKGATIKLTEDNLPIYERCIVAYEGNKLEVKEDGIYINGEKTDSYTFNMDYYWMMGDNRDKSADSRYWGFVPEDHVVGKPIVVWLSLDKDRSWFDGKIRWNRIFKWVDNIKMKKGWKIAITIVGVALVVVLLRGCVATSYLIPSSGMENSLYQGERILVNKWSYGLRLSFMKLWGYHRWADSPVQKEDILVFNNPANLSEPVIDRREVFISRCIGTPGDTLLIDSLFQ